MDSSMLNASAGVRALNSTMVQSNSNNSSFLTGNKSAMKQGGQSHNNSRSRYISFINKPIQQRQAILNMMRP